MLSDNIIIELYELSRNMNWLYGYTLIGRWYVMGLILGRFKLNLFLLKLVLA